MTDTCIVCLGDLRLATEQAEDVHSIHGFSHDDDDANEGLDVYTDTDAGAHADTAIPTSLLPQPQQNHSQQPQQPQQPITSTASLSPPKLTLNEHVNTTTTSSAVTANQSKQAEDDETIAHLLPCGHNMHDSCLRPWVERANSCPICRAQFNMVELRKCLDTPAYSSYAIQDKQQQAEVDATLVIDDDLLDLDVEEPCVVCGVINNDYDVMYCDGCDGTVHIFCAGYTECPDVWYCETCLDADTGAPLVHVSRTVAPSGTASAARHTRRRGGGGRGRRAQVSEWDRVWQQVWDRLNIDLDHPFRDTQLDMHRAEDQQAGFDAWRNRLEVANRQGGANRFRDTASTLLNRRPHVQQRPPVAESPEEVKAWNAFDRAMLLSNEERPTSRRKRKSTTTSPASPRGSDVAPERKLKRPRTRRNYMAAEPGPSTLCPLQPAADQPSFLKSLLQEVEKQPAPSERSSPEGDQSGDEQLSPYVLSPASSPLNSAHASPRALSVTPPPQSNPRPSSPIAPLASVVRPRYASPTFSPTVNLTDRGRQTLRSPVEPSSPIRNSSPSSPSRNMSYSTKMEIQRMVKAALKDRYREKQITKDQYTDINRDVSRTLYDKVGGSDGLTDQEGRDKWQQYATDEVERAVEAIRIQQQGDGDLSTSS